ncbi:hypothetical protein HID58_024471 [Brassica napus]|uniref:LTI65/LTI78 N-terminal domain-containing protein n=1 Tax=Brassica napus TaxID=3708 RepID=A0ABQ7XGM4_BRANA|nr:hypothetical protein HID58_024471 [Brassica napus]
MKGHRKKGIKSRANKVFTKVKEKAKKIKNSPIKLGHSHGHNHDHDVYEEEYGKQESEWHEYTHDGVSGQPVSLCHPGEANFRHRRRSFHQEQKISDWYRWIIPNMDVRTEAPCHPPKLHDMLANLCQKSKAMCELA